MNPLALFSRTSVFALALVALSASSASAAFIQSAPVENADGGPTDYLIASTSGSLLASGYAGTGIFNLSDSQVADLAAARDYADLFAAFQPIGGTDNFVAGGISAANEPIPGLYLTSNLVAITPQMLGQSLYTLLSDNGNSSLATSFALFESNETLSADPLSPPIPNTYLVTPSTSTIIVGTPGPKVFSPVLQASFNTIELVAVPEPSSFAVAITGLALVSLRRRR